MNRNERRRIDKELGRVMKKAPDDCTLCGKPFLHNVRTYGGPVAGGGVHWVGQCCVGQLTALFAQGVYLSRHSDVTRTLAPAPTEGRDMPPRLGAEEIERTLGRIQSAYSELDGLADQAARRAGMRGGSAGSIVLGDHPWKRDDAAWFMARPTRLHRLREPFDGEIEASFDSRLPPAPPGHRVMLIIRQVEPGRRMRLPFFANNEVPVPDHEHILHGLFDSVADQHEGTVSVRQVAERARSLTPGSGRIDH